MVAKVLLAEPTYSIAALAYSAPYRDPVLREQYASRLAAAGLPGESTAQRLDQ